MSEELGEKPAVYVRRSTREQEEQHQVDDIKRWLDYNGRSIGEVSTYVETASGASGNRPKFRQLIEDIESGEVTDVVVWEISRIARNGLLAQEFFEACEDANVTIHVTDGAVRRVEPDGHGRLVADIVASVAAEERRRLIQRTKSGIRRAKTEGKWVGQVPAGFIRVDGYLRPNLSPDYDEGETGYHDLVDALEDIDGGKSYRSVARDTPNTTRQTLMNIYKDDERRSWYLEGEPQDERVRVALDGVDTETEPNLPPQKQG